MLVYLAASFLAAPQLNILFLGNSHTASHDVPKMVQELIQSNGTRTRVSTKMIMTGFVEQLANSKETKAEINSRRWQVLVLQGAKLSNSHKNEYDHSGAVEVAKWGKQAGMKVLLFAEWPRRGWNETDYILKEYREISGPSGARIVPICRVWDRLLSQKPRLDLWAPDGNHSSPLGAFTAACTLAAFIAPTPNQLPGWRPQTVDPRLAEEIKRLARDVALATK